jgi:hypothetical protein
VLLRVDNCGRDPGDPHLMRRTPHLATSALRLRPPLRQWRAALLLLAVVALAFGAVYLVENWTLVLGYLPR